MDDGRIDGPRGDLPSCRPVLWEAERLRRRPFSAGSVSPLLPSVLLAVSRRCSPDNWIYCFIVGGCGRKWREAVVAVSQTQPVAALTSLSNSPWLWEN